MAKDAKKGHRGVNRPNNKVEKVKKELIASLLQKCTNYGNVTEDELRDIHSLISQIDQLEQPFTSMLTSMERNSESFDQFIEFCESNGVDTSLIEIAPIKIDESCNNEFGLLAKSNIQQGQEILTIPRKLILTVNDYMSNLNSASRKSEFDKSFIEFISTDPLLSEMPNLVLAMILMREFTDENSFWQPYFNILPVSYKTPLFFNLDEFQELKCTSVYEEATRLLRSIARQYSYFWTQMQSARSPASRISFKKNFTFQFYRWAVSTVMTRQNLVPSFPGHANGNNNSNSTGSGSSNALIPLWDMCNHRSGKFSTDFNLEKDAIVCYAMDDFNASSEIVIHYGNRANRDFFLHNGFVDVNNDYDFINLRLGISKSDPLASSKLLLCNKLNIPSNGFFLLKRAHCPRDESLVAFLRIFHMNQDELQHWIAKESDDLCQLFTSNDSQFTHLDPAVTKFLAIRASLLMKSYPKDEQFDKLTNQNIRRIIQIDLSVYTSYIE